MFALKHLGFVCQRSGWYVFGGHARQIASAVALHGSDKRVPAPQREQGTHSPPS